MHLRILALLVPLGLTLGCQTVEFGDPESPFFPPPKGSTVTLHQDLEFFPQTARVFFQRGITYGYYGFNRYYPWCYIQINTVVDAPQTLKANTFEVYKVVSRTEQVVENEPIRVADMSTQWGDDVRLAFGGGNGGDGPATVYETVQLWLRSDQKSDVRKMVCGGGEDNPALVLPPSIKEIQHALGSFATLEIPQQP